MSAVSDVWVSEWYTDSRAGCGVEGHRGRATSHRVDGARREAERFAAFYLTLGVPFSDVISRTPEESLRYFPSSSAFKRSPSRPAA